MQNQEHLFPRYNDLNSPKQIILYDRYNNNSRNSKIPIKFTVIPQFYNKPYSLSCPKTISRVNTSTSSILNNCPIEPINKQQNVLKSSAYFENSKQSGFISSQSSLFHSQLISSSPYYNSKIQPSVIKKSPSNIIIKYSSPLKHDQRYADLSQSKMQDHAQISEFFPKQENKQILDIYRNKLKQSYLSQNSIHSDKSGTSKKKLKVTLAGDIYYNTKQSINQQKSMPIIKNQNKQLGYINLIQKLQLKNHPYYESFQKQPTIIKRPLSQLPIMSSKQRQIDKSKFSPKLIRFNYISSPAKTDDEIKKRIKLNSFHLNNPAKFKLKKQQCKSEKPEGNKPNQQGQIKIHVTASDEVNNQYFPEFKIKKKKTLKKSVNKFSPVDLESDRRNTFIDKLQCLQKQKQKSIMEDYGLPLETTKQFKYATCSNSSKAQQSTIKPFIKTIKLSCYGEEAQRKKIIQKEKILKQSRKISDYEINSQNQSEQLSLSSRQQTNSIFSKAQSSNETHDEQLAKKIKKELNLNFSYKCS